MAKTVHSNISGPQAHGALTQINRELRLQAKKFDLKAKVTSWF